MVEHSVENKHCTKTKGITNATVPASIPGIEAHTIVADITWFTPAQVEYATQANKTVTTHELFSYSCERRSIDQKRL